MTELQRQNSKLYSAEERNAELDTSSKEIVQNAVQGETKIRNVKKHGRQGVEGLHPVL